MYQEGGRRLRMGMTDPVDVFDNDDVEVGEEAPPGDELTDEELAAVRAGQADPTTPPADAEVS